MIAKVTFVALLTNALVSSESNLLTLGIQAPVLSSNPSPFVSTLLTFSSLLASLLAY